MVNIVSPHSDRPLSLLVGHADGIKSRDQAARFMFAMVIQPVWQETTGDLLRESYGLNRAEIEILQSFVETGSVATIAEQRQRSVRTVRTQLSRVFAQMGISGQTELAFFLATLGDMQSTLIPRESETAAAEMRRQVTSHLLQISGKDVEVYEYGAPDGAPVLLLQSTHPPELTAELRAQIKDAGLRVIAPLKPGAGRSAVLKGRPGPEEMASIYVKVMDAFGLEQALVAGQASGGLYALEFARQFQRRVQAVCLIDTGVPFAGRAELMRLPPCMKRTMVPARYLPDLLYLPHRIVAANFYKSAEGEANVVDYFFTDSPVERELTRTKRACYDATRALLRYSFEDTDRLVDDVSRWAGKWGPLLEEVSQGGPVCFVQGRGNQMFPPEKIKRWIAGRPRCSLVEVPQDGQLAVFTHPQVLVQALVQLSMPPGSVP